MGQFDWLGRILRVPSLDGWTTVRGSRLTSRRILTTRLIVDFRFYYPSPFEKFMIKELPNNEPVDILCHHSVSNKNMKSDKINALTQITQKFSGVLFKLKFK